ncbi:hypothetical protein AVL59_32845 [Streptomyces griseochromogenes]|uniref:Uncharacterized protein n=1 Tax=Streptomyces griseochromogenes TaxID=68214 RepID=A0A1B1B4G3_9ACTN|nr:hypothetical protein AVL59_32845 [Streptomyces griseochromogenes]
MLKERLFRRLREVVGRGTGGLRPDERRASIRLPSASSTGGGRRAQSARKTSRMRSASARFGACDRHALLSASQNGDGPATVGAAVLGEPLRQDLITGRTVGDVPLGH